MALIGRTDDERIWNYFYGKGLSKFGTAGLMGNLFAESGLISYRVQGDFQSGYIYSKNYTLQVDKGTISENDFIHNAPNGGGYGLAQWTYWSRKQKLWQFAKSRNKSIGDLEMQLEFLYNELSENYCSVLSVLKTATSITQASNSVLFNFENPLDKGTKVQNDRASFGHNYYTQFVTNASKGDDINMGYKVCTKGITTQLSTHFNSSEFDCHGSGCCSQTKVNETLIEYLQKIRTHFGQPITITSAYRCPTHNSRVGGATGSRHSKGDAADIVVKGVTPRKVAQYAESIGIKGIGLYETGSDGYFTHIDTRTTKSFWYGQREEYRSTFGTYAEDGSSANSATNSTVSNGINILNTILNRGDYGADVKELQEKLIKLGYSCGDRGADGDFGTSTEAAVRKFQRNTSGLVEDGIAGYQTLKAIDDAIKKLNTNNSNNKVRITASLLNVRAGAGTNYRIVAQIRKGIICEVTQENNGWCKLVSPAGWVSANYIEKI